MKEFVAIHNMPAPYKLHQYRVLDEHLRARGFSFCVHFLSKMHRDRPHWVVRPEDLPFQHRFWWDVGPRIHGGEVHLNPTLIASLTRHRPDYLFLSGPWETLTGMIVSRLPAKKLSIASFDGSSKSPGRLSGPLAWLKRSSLGRFPVVAVPGIETERLARLLLEKRPTPRFVSFPNLVDERSYRPRTGKDDVTAVREALGVVPGTRMALWIARLIPEKGILEVLSALPPSALEGWTLVILGAGPLHDAIAKLLGERGLEGSVRIAPPSNRWSMPEIYRAADLFWLPSLNDPNPLSVVEALHSGLPLVLSDRVGNQPEAIREGENGWTVDPSSPASIREVFPNALSQSAERLREMGRRSREIAEGFWSSDTATDRFLDEILAI